MPLVQFTTPDGRVTAVRTDDLFVAMPALGTPEDDTSLLWDAPREILVAEGLASVSQKLGASFVKLSAAGRNDLDYLVSKTLVTVVAPHPEHADVCILQGKSRKLYVKGTLGEIIALLG